MTFQTSILTSSQRKAFKTLGLLATREGYYLAGGTAIALLAGHRKSVDLDWFAAHQPKDPGAWSSHLGKMAKGFETLRVAEGTVHGSLYGVRVSFLMYKYPLLEPLLACTPFACNLASPRDLACMKLVAIVQRGSKKDFTDIFALGRRSLPLPAMLDAYQEKYKVRDVSEVLWALTYFDDAEASAMPVMLWKENWKAIKKQIVAWVRAY
ncbi:MAG: nucleotidyl transferase AbiEii/AbiGii toxin family protein [Planctomycetes bacterium]|nr:nucleotidyl transferase AbiEii/AbiGii toxin family protein [Planctomycetota bacterium]